MLFSGCHGDAPAEAEVTIPCDISEFDFSLPEGYTFAEDAANSLSIMKNGDPIGGLVLTGLDISCYGPLPLICEYIVMQGDGFLAISMAVTDPDTDIRTETSHRLFAHGGRCFDLWFVDSLSDDDRTAITNAIWEI